MLSPFDPFQLGGQTLRNRIVMAPLTRRRAYGPGLSATPLTAEYYRQRATAGLIVAEAMQPSPVGQGYTYTPGMHTPEQVASWRPVTESVHDAGGVIFGQLQHAGRNSHPDLLPDGLHPVGPSAIAADGVVRVSTTGPAVRKPYPVPLELTARGIQQTVDDFCEAAANCMLAGFDGVELHGAYGYLIHQFLSSSANTRTDGYGTTITGRIRFPLELVTAVADRIGAGNLALRISPGCTAGGIGEDDLTTVYLSLIDALPCDLAYLHLFEFPGHRDLTEAIRGHWNGPLVLNPHADHGDWPTGPDQLRIVSDGLADMIAFGSSFISNPDLVERLRTGAPLTPADHDTFYLGDHHGYTDYLPYTPLMDADR